MPAGWRIDKTVGSPLSGHVFVTDGRSVLHGQNRALLRMRPTQNRAPECCPQAPASEPALQPKAPPPPPPPEYAKTANTLARAQFKRRLMADILADLMVCEIEGWDKREYIRDLQALVSSISTNGAATSPSNPPA